MLLSQRSSFRSLRSSVWAFGFATATLLAGAGIAATAGASPSLVLVWILAAFVPYAGLSFVMSRPEGPSTAGAAPTSGLVWVLGLAAICGGLQVVAPPVLSDDVYRYLWDGRVLGHGTDPYLYAPDSPQLASLRDDGWARINNPEIPTIYPPLAQVCFALAAAVGAGPWSVKLFALVVHLATTVAVGRAAGEARERAQLLYALNPLALTESALGGHIDVAAGLALLATGMALSGGRPGWAALFSTFATALKLVGLALVPLLFPSSRRAGWVALGVGLGCAAWLAVGAGRGSEVPSGFGQYARRWQGNEGLFAVVEGAVGVGVEWVGHALGAAPGHIRLRGLGPALRVAEGTAWDPRAGLVPEKKAVVDREDFEAPLIAQILARGLVVAGVWGLAWWLGRRRVEPLLAARWIVLGALLFSPQIHPWYLLWLLPLEIAVGRAAGLVWSASVMVAYAPLERWLLAREWFVSGWAQGAEFAFVFAALVLEERQRWRLGKLGCERALPP